MYGTELARTEFTPRRDGIGAVERTPAGNVALRIGREIDHTGAWEQIAYVVLTSREVAAVMSLLARAHTGGQ